MQMLTPAKGHSHIQDRAASIYDVRLKSGWGGPAELFIVPHAAQYRRFRPRA
jgi:hypothetical protein